MEEGMIKVHGRSNALRRGIGVQPRGRRRRGSSEKEESVSSSSTSKFLSKDLF